MAGEQIIGTSALAYPYQKDQSLGLKIPPLKVAPKLLYQAAEFLCLPKNPDPSIYRWFLQVAQDQLPTSPLERNLALIKTIVQNPTAPASFLTEQTGFNELELQQNQKWMQSSKLLKEVLTSHYYPGYLFVRYAQSFLKDLTLNSANLKAVLNGDPIFPKKLEIHATNAKCNYRCNMCLWDVQSQGDYHAKEKRLKVLNTALWKNILTEAKESGTETIIFSGGGEPLLRPDFSQILDHAQLLDLYTMVYTNGSRLANYSSRQHSTYISLLASDWLRVSLHATSEDVYSKLVNLPTKSKPFGRVIKGLEQVIKDRDRLGSPLQVGAGFVIQHSNYHQIEEIARLSRNLGLDFLNLRIDCIDITQKLKPEQEKQLYSALQNVRDGLENGAYDQLTIDFADSLVSHMNGWSNQPNIDQTHSCFIHHYRPAIDPYGRFAVCDLASEPFFSRDDLTLGYIGPKQSYNQVLTQGAKKEFHTNKCKSCMPGQQAINAMWQKVLLDSAGHIDPAQQPLLFN